MMKVIWAIISCIAIATCKPATLDKSRITQSGFNDGDTGETDWWQTGQDEMNEALDETIRITQQIRQAKNVILFIGDGMGVTTVTASRIYHAQSRKLSGKDANLAFENFPYVALSKTYNTDAIVGDSAATGTAFTSGYKAKSGTLGVNQNVFRKNCTNAMENKVTSYLQYAMREGKWGGVVTTTRVTHATPAATYAHSGERNWESDTDVIAEVDSPEDREKCPDIASQLINTEENRDIRVILGGGRSKFMLDTQEDPEYEVNGTRKDADLIAQWKEYKQQALPNNPEKYKYVFDQEGFDDVDESEVDYLLGLFEPSHMLWETDRENEPSLAEMTTKAIKMLQRSDNGFALMVEGGRIDHAHHETWTYNSLNETVAFSDAVKAAVDLTDSSETLIVVTADHSHAFAFNGYPYISSNIVGLVEEEDSFHNELILSKMDDGKPYSALMYTNGPGYEYHRTNESGSELPRMDLTNDEDIGKPFYFYDTAMNTYSETHGGEEVAIYASGPMSHLFHATHEQNYIAHVLMYAACIGPNKDHCNNERVFPLCIGGANGSFTSYYVTFTITLIGWIVNLVH